MEAISLIVCTHNRAGMLPACVAAASRQTLGRRDYEVIVVDNASTDHTAAIVRAMRGVGGVKVRYVRCERLGLSRARNAGARAARAPVAAYIDDDAMAAPDLLERLLEVYEAHPEAGCVGGTVELAMPPGKPEWLTGDFDGYYSAYRPGGREPRKLAGAWEYPYGANVSFRKEAMRDAGYFRVWMGRTGNDFAGGEEIDLASRVARLGWEIYAQPRAAVRHVILPERVKWEHIAKSAAAAGASWVRYEREGLQPAVGLREEFRAWRRAWGEARRAGPRTVERAQEIFARAKLMGKLKTWREAAWR